VNISLKVLSFGVEGFLLIADVDCSNADGGDVTFKDNFYVFYDQHRF